MAEHSVRSVLRIVAIVAALIGAILTTASVFGVVGIEASVGGVAGPSMGAMAHALVWSHVSIIPWGLFLFVFSGPLARLVVR